jgi:hypothetical protein
MGHERAAQVALGAAVALVADKGSGDSEHGTPFQEEEEQKQS